VFENRVLRGIFGPMRDEVTEEWRKLHNEDLHNLYSSPDIIRQMKSRGMGWDGMGRASGTHGRGEKSVQGFGEKSPKERYHWEDQVVDGRIGSKWTSGGLPEVCGVDSVGSR
jgi:hypothetical protein